MSAAAERTSLFNQFSRRTVNDPKYDFVYYNELGKKLDPYYPKAPHPLRAFASFPSLSELTPFIAEAISYVKRDSSPGAPFDQLFAANAAIIDSYYEDLTKLVYVRLKLLSEYTFDSSPDFKVRPSLLNLGPVPLIYGGYCDPVRTFEKFEPHSESKMKTQRYRLINNVSLLDKIVEIVLFKKQNIAEIANWHTIPSKPGMGFTDAHIKSIRAHFEHIPDPTSSDVIGYDIALRVEMIMADAYRRIRLGSVIHPWLKRAMLARAWCLCNTVYALSDGSMYAQVDPGSQCSGSNNTSSTNSWTRALAATSAGATHVFAQGDDAIETYSSVAPETYKAMGMPLKMYERITGTEFEFCSHLFKGDGAIPLNHAKSLVKLLSRTGLSAEQVEEALEQFSFEYRSSPLLGRCLEIIRRVGWDRQYDQGQRPGGGCESSSQPPSPGGNLRQVRRA